MSSRFGSTPARSSLPEWYPQLLGSVVEKINAGRLRTAVAANRETIATYWAIGQDILARQSEEGWGSRVVDRLSSDLRERFPGTKGLSPRNLKYMRTFASTWSRDAIVQAPLAQLPWYHHIALMEKLQGTETRLWYAQKALAEGWSRNVLVLQIETRLHERAGKATSNFQATLPPSSSDLAQEATKDPYIFDFLDMTGRATERDLERQLIKHVERFLLELGRGFAFVGRQIRLDLGGDEFFPDCSDSRIIRIAA